MCAVSMILDHYRDKWDIDKYQKWPYTPAVPFPETAPSPIVVQPQVSKKEFDELKRQVEEMIELVKRAKEYDEKNNEPDCEMDDKVEFIRKVAALVGVNLNEVLKPKKKAPKSKTTK